MSEYYLYFWRSRADLFRFAGWMTCCSGSSPVTNSIHRCKHRAGRWLPTNLHTPHKH